MRNKTFRCAQGCKKEPTGKLKQCLGDPRNNCVSEEETKEAEEEEAADKEAADKFRKGTSIMALSKHCAALLIWLSVLCATLGPAHADRSGGIYNVDRLMAQKRSSGLLEKWLLQNVDSGTSFSGSMGTGFGRSMGAGSILAYSGGPTSTGF
ncbi:hypothetical protein B484DRAFT_411844, partial [Ochromonadaceae sp. CCMP2298]